MTYFLSFFTLALKSLIYIIEQYQFSASFLDLSRLIMEFCFLIFIIKYVMKLPMKETVFDHIMKYRFEYSFEYYYSLFIVLFVTISNFSLIFYLRCLNIEKELNIVPLLDIFIQNITELPLILCLCFFSFFFLVIYLFILVLKVIKIYINKEFVKLHFYFLENPLYQHLHYFFKMKFSIDAIYGYVFDLYMNFIVLLALGYKPKSYLRTKKEKKIIADFHEKIDLFFNVIFFRSLLFNLHYIFFFIILFYDIFFNDFILTTTFKFLPLMLLYQIFVLISKFIEEKPLSDICYEAHILFYHKVTILNEKTMLLEGNIYSAPQNFGERFLLYEASGFTLLEKQQIKQSIINKIYVKLKKTINKK